MKAPIDISTTSPEALARRIQALEDRIASLERERVSKIAYISGNAAEIAAKLAALSGGTPGSMVAIFEDLGGEGIITNIGVLYPGLGWVRF